jgi:CHAT domain-containing protein
VKARHGSGARPVGPPSRAALVALCALGVTLIWTAPAPSQGLSAQRLAQGQAAFDQARFEQAIARWGEALRLLPEEALPARADTLTRLSQAYQALGHYRLALDALDSALDAGRRSGESGRIGTTRAAGADLRVALGEPARAHPLLDEALERARQSGDARLEAIAMHVRGNAFAAEERPAEALRAYRESAALALRAGLPALRARALAAAGGAAHRSGELEESASLVEAAAQAARGLPPSQHAVATWTVIGLGYRDLAASQPGQGAPLLLRAAEALRRAAAEAEALGDRRGASYAWGYLGSLYALERRHEEALELTRRALLAAQQVAAPESLYRWEWQSGRLFRELGRPEEALGAYRRAVRTLQSIRPELLRGHGAPRIPFRDSIGPLHFELVDLLLRRAAALPDAERSRPYLVEAREVVEIFKAEELRDYFRDDCVDAALARVAPLEVLSRTAVVIYPILLADRTELLVSLPERLVRRSVPVPAAEMTAEVRRLRRMLEKRTTREYLPHAQRLYDWLIRPLEPDLAGSDVTTLVFVPDGALRTIPMAALHDGERFLVERYALAITPGLNLTDPRPLRREQMAVLAAGVAAPVQGFPSLPNVKAELDALRALFGSRVLIDEAFRVGELERTLRDERFTVVHIASHGQFTGDVDGSFVLAFDDKLTMDRLDRFVGFLRFRDDPLELLTLSACDTAAGDDRAALGLAGIAVRAGARSALATLWQVNDEVAVDLVGEFYRHLKRPDVSRASALQLAQLKVLRDARYEHPGFWAPFLLINNWL